MKKTLNFFIYIDKNEKYLQIDKSISFCKFLMNHNTNRQ